LAGGLELQHISSLTTQLNEKAFDLEVNSKEEESCNPVPQFSFLGYVSHSLIITISNVCFS
jgi:hypothetical protein